ncbi:hypothetical protein CBW53_03125 [Yersinia frederiksenii]|nr:hypothetical protein CBW53_03125 [Yersinia frederiksenii]
MEAIIEVGQAIINVNGKDYFFNPSFLAMSKIGTPEQIVKAFVSVHGGNYPNKLIDYPYINKYVINKLNSPLYGSSVLQDAIIIMQSCCDDDISNITGYYTFSSRNKYIYHRGLFDIKAIIVMACHLIKHGTIGDKPPKIDKKEKAVYSSEFNAIEYVSLAVAHLGYSESEAWNMTMTSLNAALNAKFPQKEKAKIPTKEEYDEMSAWADSIIAKDNKINKKVH